MIETFESSYQIWCRPRLGLGSCSLLAGSCLAKTRGKSARPRTNPGERFSRDGSSHPSHPSPTSPLQKSPAPISLFHFLLLPFPPSQKMQALARPLARAAPKNLSRAAALSTWSAVPAGPPDPILGESFNSVYTSPCSHCIPRLLQCSLPWQSSLNTL